MQQGIEQIPGPPRQPGDGAGEIAAAGGLHNYQLRLHAEYGPLVRFQLPGVDTAVSVADPVLLVATAGLNERPEKLFEFLSPLCEAGNLQTLPAGEHAPWRRLILSVLAGRPSHEAHFAEFTALATELAERWARRGPGDPVELQRDLSELSLRMICDFSLGGGLDDAESPGRVVAAFEDVLTGTRVEEALGHLRTTVDRVLEAHRARGTAEGDKSDLVATMAKAGVSPARIRDTVLMTMLAAHHTTGVAISWTLYLLGQHSEVADRVGAELDQVLGDRTAPGYADLKRLPYLEMVLKESMRLYTPGPYGARETTEELALGGFTIPAKTTIFYPFWAVHKNPAYWPDPEAFVPERFTPEETAKRPRYAYIPFGLGPRSCEGAGLAMVEAELVLAILLKRFRFRLAPGHTVTPVERFVLWAAEDIRMNLAPR